MWGQGPREPGHWGTGTPPPIPVAAGTALSALCRMMLFIFQRGAELWGEQK